MQVSNRAMVWVDRRKFSWKEGRSVRKGHSGTFLLLRNFILVVNCARLAQSHFETHQCAYRDKVTHSRSHTHTHAHTLTLTFTHSHSHTPPPPHTHTHSTAHKHQQQTLTHTHTDIHLPSHCGSPFRCCSFYSSISHAHLSRTVCPESGKRGNLRAGCMLLWAQHKMWTGPMSMELKFRRNAFFFPSFSCVCIRALTLGNRDVHLDAGAYSWTNQKAASKKAASSPESKFKGALNFFYMRTVG
jgi:hypothetical protein